MLESFFFSFNTCIFFHVLGQLYNSLKLLSVSDYPMNWTLSSSKLVNKYYEILWNYGYMYESSLDLYVFLNINLPMFSYPP